MTKCTNSFYCCQIVWLGFWVSTVHDCTVWSVEFWERLAVYKLDWDMHYLGLALFITTLVKAGSFTLSKYQQTNIHKYKTVPSSNLPRNNEMACSSLSFFGKKTHFCGIQLPCIKTTALVIWICFITGTWHQNINQISSMQPH